MVARFDHPAEITLNELRVELLYPMDEDGPWTGRTSGGLLQVSAG
jgi:hypothetical protein